jgi:two-component SAPR family response regulator
MIGHPKDLTLHSADVLNAGIGGYDRQGRLIQVDYPVCIITFGHFSVYRYQQLLTRVDRARHQRPLELLQALVAFGGRGIHTELLSHALWPDTEGDKAQNAFDVTLHRLRQLLELKELVLINDRRVTLNCELAWVDVWAFERAVNYAERLLHRLDDAEAAAQLVDCEDHLLALYQGAFLEREATRPWALSLRERLRSKLLRHLCDAGRAWETQVEWERAIRAYRRGLEIDPLLEPLYQRLMLCFRQTGRIAEAVATYQRCRALLTGQLQIEPSRATRELYNTFIS